jgi:hypothetical protein
MTKISIIGMAASTAAFTIALATAGAALAQGQPPGADRSNTHVERFLMVYDANGDGTVSQAEIAAEQNRIFGAVDLDGDGKLSVAEFRRRGRLIMRTGGATLFDMLDVNGDQQVTAEELHGPKARWLKRYNTDGADGLGAEELATALERRQRRSHRRMRR